MIDMEEGGEDCADKAITSPHGRVMNGKSKNAVQRRAYVRMIKALEGKILALEDAVLLVVVKFPRAFQTNLLTDVRLTNFVSFKQHKQQLMGPVTPRLL
jgi:hypothetical protein